jgi:hypothetical protein
VRLLSKEYIIREILYDFRYNHEATPHTTIILWYVHINYLRRDNRWRYEAGVRLQKES